MVADRRTLYKLPWSTFDNQGGWIEVTDRCNIQCPGCYRQRLEGDKPLDKVKAEILQCKEWTNCDSMVIAGGEPLIYPHILEVIRYIRSLGLKSLLLSNGEVLTEDLALQLKEAGLNRIHIHVDARQGRTGWQGKDEAALNELRQHYADLIHRVKGIQCGFHVTMVPEALDQIPAILHWYRSQPAKVQHLSLIALSGMPLNEGFGYYVKGKEIPTEALVNSYSNPSDIGLTTDQLLECVLQTYPDYRPAAYISGGARIDVNKQLFVVSVCSPRSFFGTMGARSMELTQAYARLFMGRYFSFAINPAIGKKVFFMALFDKSMRSTGRNYLAHLWKHPLHIADKIYLQSMIIQQPIDFTDGIKNTCDHCVNPMIYQDRLINPCELDAYRGYGGLIESHKKA